MYKLLAIAVLLLASCSNRPEKVTYEHVTIVRIEEYRIPNSLQDYEPHWKATMSDSSIVSFLRRPNIGDTITYTYIQTK